MPASMNYIGRYKIIGTLNEGDTSTVHLVQDRGSSKALALKLMSLDAASDPALKASFIKRAQAIRRLNVDRLPKIHDIHAHQRRPFFVMDYCSRGSLQNRIEDLGRLLRVDEGLGLATELAAAIGCLHQKGEPHGRISPKNVLIRERLFTPSGAGRGPLSNDEELVLINIDSTSMFGSGDEHLEHPSDGFLSPEQREERGIRDLRVDVYAASAIVVWAVTGIEPSPVRARTDLPYSLKALGSTGPLAAALEASLSFDAARRPSDISRWLSHLSDQKRPPPAPFVPEHDIRDRSISLAPDPTDSTTANPPASTTAPPGTELAPAPVKAAGPKHESVHPLEPSSQTAQRPRAEPTPDAALEPPDSPSTTSRSSIAPATPKAPTQEPVQHGRGRRFSAFWWLICAALAAGAVVAWLLSQSGVRAEYSDGTFGHMTSRHLESS